MKNRYIIIPAIIIVILGIITTFIFLTKNKSSSENNVAEVSIPVETSAPEPTPEVTVSPEPTEMPEPTATSETSKDSKDIDTETPTTHEEETGEEYQDAINNKPDIEDVYKKIADELGITVEEVKALTNLGNDSVNGQGNIPSTPSSSSGTGTDVEQVPDGVTNNSSSNNSDPGGYDTPLPGETGREPMDLGDGGPLTGNVQLNP